MNELQIIATCSVSIAIVQLVWFIYTLIVDFNARQARLRTYIKKVMRNKENFDDLKNLAYKNGETIYSNKVK